MLLNLRNQTFDILQAFHLIGRPPNETINSISINSFSFRLRL